ncbi:MAG TPA: hypothetical protein QGH10_25455 [Armatimonadota bacterium]|nr:hypothetical protein [Armatimonadota bacterium]
MLKFQVFVTEIPPQDEDARVVRAVEAAAGRFAGKVEVDVLPLDGPEAETIGIQASPTVMEGGMALSVGPGLSAGRLKRYIEAQLGSE